MKNILTCWCTDQGNVLDHRPADLPSSQTGGEEDIHQLIVTNSDQI